MGKRSRVQEWKNVNIDADLEHDPEFRFLGSFEELDSYDIIREHDVEKQKKRKLKKRHIDKKTANDADKTEEERKSKRATVEGSWTLPETDVQSTSQNVDMSPWNGLFVPSPVLDALRELGFSQPMEIQRLVLPSAIRDRQDILGAAETGSGKTLAFGIPIVARIMELCDSEDVPCPIALIMTPTRELAIQVKKHIQAILSKINIRIASVIGGLSVEKQRRILRKNPHILVATPGRLWQLIEEGDPFVQNLPKIQCLAIDETDRMVEKGHFAELEQILEFIDENADGKRKRQTFVFSATLTFIHPLPTRLGRKSKSLGENSTEQKILHLINAVGLRKGYETFDITKVHATADKITEARINCDSLLDKDAHLYYFLSNYPGRTLVFANSIDGTRRLHNVLTRLNLTVFLLHAKMHQNQRLKNLERFANSINGILLATDVAARGLDIRGIKHVVHYQLPRTTEIYVHRSGRTARAQEEGLSIMLIDPNDALFYKRICTNLNRARDLPVFPVEARQMPAFKDRMRMVTELEALEHKVKRTKSKESWFAHQARQMDIELDEVEIRKNMGSHTENVKNEVQLLKRKTSELKYLLSQPLPGKSSVTKYPIIHEICNDEEKDPIDLVKQEAAALKRLKISGRIRLKQRIGGRKEHHRKPKRKRKTKVKKRKTKRKG